MKNVEEELKILLTKEQYENILKSYDFNKVIIQQNTYFDDPYHTLKKDRNALRIRRLEDRSVITIKKPRDATSKFEYEQETTAHCINELNESDRKFILEHLPQLKEIDSLTPICSFTTIRNLLILPSGEICLDLTDFGSVIDYELEYEIHNDSDGKSFFHTFVQPFGLEYTKQSPSKLARALSYNVNL